MRTDPLWEFGSFGCTRCHQRNLMSPRRADELRGNLLAFAQGGDSEVRLVHVTPPIRIEHHGLFAEAKWLPAQMPLAYESAPILVDNYLGSDVPALFEMLKEGGRSTPVGQFASNFRARRRPLPADIGRQFVAVYRGFRQRGATVSQHYTDSLPFPPPRIDRDRESTYASLLSWPLS